MEQSSNKGKKKVYEVNTFPVPFPLGENQEKMSIIAKTPNQTYNPNKEILYKTIDMTEGKGKGKGNQKEAGSEVKTFTVPFALKESKENISTSIDISKKPSKKQNNINQIITEMQIFL